VANVRYWHKADIGLRGPNVCFGGKAGIHRPSAAPGALRFGGRLSGLVAVSECMRRLAKQLELGG